MSDQPQQSEEIVNDGLAFLSECTPETAAEAIEMLKKRLGKPFVVDKAIGQEDKNAPKAINLRRLGQFLAEVGDPPPMLIEGVLPEKSLVLLTGKPKFGKSLLAMDMAERVAFGLPLWGNEGDPMARRVNRPGPVVYLSMEDGELETARRYRQRKHTPDSTAEIYICTDRVPLGSAEHVAILRRALTGLGVTPVLVFVDTGREGLGVKDYGDAAELADRLRALREFAREICTVVLVLHNRKAEATDAVDEIAGSNAITSSVDGWISARRKEDREEGQGEDRIQYRRLFLTIDGRGGMGGTRKDVCVEFSSDGMRFREVDPDVIQGERQQEKAGKADGRLKERLQPVLSYLKGEPDGATVQDIANVCNLTYETARRMVADGQQNGQIIQSGERATGRRPAPLYIIHNTQNNSHPIGKKDFVDNGESDEGEDGGLL